MTVSCAVCCVHTQVVFLTATVEGLLYEHGLPDLAHPNGPMCALEGEWVYCPG